MRHTRWSVGMVFAAAGLVGLADALRLVVRYSGQPRAQQASWYVVFVSASLLLLAIMGWVKGHFLPLGVLSEGDRRGIVRVGTCLLLLVVYAGLMPMLGYTLASTMFFLLYLRRLGEFAWGRALLIAALVSAAFGFSFARAGMALPRGLVPWP